MLLCRVPWCYASYVPALGNWARYLWLYPASGAGQEGEKQA